MKGQYRIINEVMIFAIGVAIASFIIVNFQNVQDTMARTSSRIQMETVSDLMASALLKASLVNSSISVRIPSHLSNNMYMIEVSTTGGPCVKGGTPCFMNFSTKGSGYTKKLFNIEQTHSIIGKSISGSEYLKIESSDGNITIK